MNSGTDTLKGPGALGVLMGGPNFSMGGIGGPGGVGGSGGVGGPGG